MDYLSGWCNSQKRLDNVTAIITGGNAGIGKQTVLDFYMRGARVIMACRNIDKASAAKREIEESTVEKKTGTLLIEIIDLCSLESVRQFAKRVLDREERVNILVNNAGVMCCPASKTEDGFETHIGSNHFAHALLTLLLLPKIIRSGPSRIVFVSSDLHYFYKMNFYDMNFDVVPYEPLEAYSRSKIANVMFARALALYLEKHNIKHTNTYSLHPGVVYTDIDRHYHETSWFWASYVFRIPFLKWLWKTPKCGAQTTIFCAVDDKCANESGLYYRDCVAVPPSSYCRNDADVMRLWDITIDTLHLEDYYHLGGISSLNKCTTKITL